MEVDDCCKTISQAYYNITVDEKEEKNDSGEKKERRLP